MKKFLVFASILVFNTLWSAESTNLYYGEVSHNYIIRWGFQILCDFVYDPCDNAFSTHALHDVTFDPRLTKPGSIIYVSNPDRFFNEIDPLIKHPYIIITHGWTFFHKGYLKYIKNKKIIAWFGIQHGKIIKHPKFYPIPIGILQEPGNYVNREEYDNAFIKFRNESEKKHLLYINVFNAENDAITQYFAAKSYCKIETGNLFPFLKVMRNMAESKFVISLPKDPRAATRFWESLIAGSIPIVHRSQLDKLYKRLPIVIINEWGDINEEFLNTKYAEITSKKYDISKLYMEYWENKIKSVRNKFLLSYRQR